MAKKDALSINNIGLIGVGLMGYGIGVNLLKSGHKLFITKHKQEKNISKLKNQGANLKKSYKEVASYCDVIILCLPDSSAVEEVVLKENGLINFLKPGSVIIDCTTSDSTSVEKIRKLLAGKSSYLLDAPLTRSPKDSLLGKLNVIVGGDFDTYKNVNPVIKTFAENIFYVGETGSGIKLKLLNNFICMGFVLVVTHALAYAEKENIDVKKLDKIMSEGTNYISAIPLMIKWLNNKEEQVLQFSIKNASKDISYFKNSTNKCNIDHRLLDCMDEIFKQATHSKFGEKELPSLYDFILSCQNNKLKTNNKNLQR